MKVISAEVEIINETGEFAGYYKATVYGLLGQLKGQNIALAHFGSFERKGRFLEYSATLWRDDSGEIFHCYDSEFCDDLKALTVGNVELWN